MELTSMMKFATASLLAGSLMVVGIGCEERTGSPINGGDPVPERLDSEPPYSPEPTEPGVPDAPTGADTEPSPLGGAPPEQSPGDFPSEADSQSSDFPSSPAGSALEETDNP